MCRIILKLRIVIVRRRHHGGALAYHLAEEGETNVMLIEGRADVGLDLAQRGSVEPPSVTTTSPKFMTTGIGSIPRSRKRLASM
ncbi:MAG: hypothetical protein CM15mP103_08050 [Gammaproteobacteria bacterium]|nr:MAG: hypothetical protein CM15mP103_08050 [Gammaproteobacteria bacterium]